MTDTFTIDDFYFEQDHFAQAKSGTILMPNGYGLYFEQQDANPRDIAFEDALFLVKTLKPYGIRDPQGEIFPPTMLMKAPMPEIKLHGLEHDDTLTGLNAREVAAVINRVAELEQLWLDRDAPAFPYILAANVLDKNENQNPAINVTQAWKTPVNKYTGQMDPSLKGNESPEEFTHS